MVGAIVLGVAIQTVVFCRDAGGFAVDYGCLDDDLRNHLSSSEAQGENAGPFDSRLN